MCTVGLGHVGAMEVWTSNTTPSLEEGELLTRWYPQNLATLQWSVICERALGRNSWRDRVWGRGDDPVRMWHSRFRVISTPPTFKEAKESVS